MTTRLLDIAEARRQQIDEFALDGAGRAVAAWSDANPFELEREWTYRAPEIVSAVSGAQVSVAQQTTLYVAASAAALGASTDPARLVAGAFAGATREGREVGPELYTGVTHTKRLIGAGMGVGQAFRAGTALMAILAANTIRDAGRSADSTLSVGQGFTYSVRVVQPGACSRCAILAGVKGFRTDFQRHPGCRCSSMLLKDADTPEGFFRSPDDYFESLTEAEQNRTFTESGAWAIRNGADPIKVVNARRGARGIGYNSSNNFPWKPGDTRGRLQPITIGTKADGTPLQVFATTEGTTARGAFGRGQNLDVRGANDRYRRTSTLRLMPEQIRTMSETPERARELLERYGYLN